MRGRRLDFAPSLAAVVVLALVVRLLVVIATPNFVAVTDAGDFDAIAASVAQHGSFPASGLTAGGFQGTVSSGAGGPTAFRPPLFPIALAGVYKLVGPSSKANRWQAGRVFEVLLGALAVALIGLIAARLWGAGTGLLAAAMAAVYPPLILIGSSLLSESLFIPLLLAAVLAALRHREQKHRWRWALISGLLVGLAALTRTNGIVLVVPICFMAWSERPRRSWRALAAPLVVAAAALLVVIPWLVRDADVFHRFVPISTEGGYGLAGTYSPLAQARSDAPGLWAPPLAQMRQVFAGHPQYNEAQVSDRLDGIAVDYVRAHPTSVLKVGWWNTLRLLNLTGPGIERSFAGGEGYPQALAVLSVYAFWLIAALALAGAFTRAARRAPPALWACPVMIFLSTVFVIGLTRYRSPIDPFALMLAALGLLTLWRRPATARTGGR